MHNHTHILKLVKGYDRITSELKKMYKLRIQCVDFQLKLLIFIRYANNNILVLFNIFVMFKI